jgi:CheY-like chemotaxis protein
MSDSSQTRILIVDDDPGLRQTVAMLLASKGYEIATAEDGFDALLQMKTRLPEVIVSDLNMPQMSGFEFLTVVRRRFPQVSVIAMSGAYHSGVAAPSGVVADAFYRKGQCSPEALLHMVADLSPTTASRAADHERTRSGVDTQKLPRFARNTLRATDL